MWIGNHLMPTETMPDPCTEYRVPALGARAAAINAALGADAESQVETVWLLRYTTVKHDI